MRIASVCNQNKASEFAISFTLCCSVTFGGFIYLRRRNMQEMTSPSVKDTPSKRCNRICSVPQCSNKANRVTGISLHSFPKCATLRKQWGILFRFGKDIPMNAVACSEHFSTEAFMIQRKYELFLSKWYDHSDIPCKR